MGRLTYTPRYVAFLDVLGFGALVDRSGTHQRERSVIIRRIRDAIDWSLKDLSKYKDSGACFTQFSDSFVVSVSASNSNKFDLSYFCLCIHGIITNFLQSNLLIRGGITKGLLIHEGPMVFGPAMNRAYFLESRCANFPRVIVDEKIVGLPEELDYSIMPIQEDDDGLFFVDYFHPVRKFYLMPYVWRDIQETAANIPQSPILSEKKDWIVRKYNSAISNFTYNGFMNDLEEYIDDVDSNHAVEQDRLKILKVASKIKRIPERKR